MRPDGTQKGFRNEIILNFAHQRRILKIWTSTCCCTESLLALAQHYSCHALQTQGSRQLTGDNDGPAALPSINPARSAIASGLRRGMTDWSYSGMMSARTSRPSSISARSSPTSSHNRKPPADPMSDNTGSRLERKLALTQEPLFSCSRSELPLPAHYAAWPLRTSLSAVLNRRCVLRLQRCQSRKVNFDLGPVCQRDVIAKPTSLLMRGESVGAVKTSVPRGCSKPCSELCSKMSLLHGRYTFKVLN